MLDITVKTLDGRNRSFSVPDDITVRQFKEKIAASIEIDADTQRLIFQGRVLVDEKKIDDYNVNGKTIHVVQKPPPSAHSSSGPSQAESGPRRTRDDLSPPEGSSFVLGSFTLPSDTSDPAHVRNVVHQMLSGIVDGGRNARGPMPNSGPGPSVDVHINMNQNTASHAESQGRINQALEMLSMATDTINRLENPDDTSSPGASGRGAGIGHSNGSQPATLNVLSSLLDDVLRLQDRLRPHLLRYRQLLNDDPDFTNRTEEMQRSQRVCHLTAEAVHSLSHTYHHISDLIVDLSMPPPRHVRAISSPTVVQQTIPVQINVAHVPVSVGNPPPAGMQPRPATATATAPTGVPTMSTATNRTPGPGFGGMPSFRPHMGAGPMPFPPPPGMPPGFHVFMEMTPGGGMMGRGGSGPAGPSMHGQGRAPESQPSADSTNASPRPDSSDMPMPPGGGMFPPGDFLQNVIQMAANAAFRGATGQQNMFMMSSSDDANPDQPSESPGGSIPSSPQDSNRPSTAGTAGGPASTQAPPAQSTPGPVPTSAHPSGMPGMGMPGMGMPGMGMPPFLPPRPDMFFMDPFLPCNSRHFHSHRGPTSMAGHPGGPLQNPGQALAGVVSSIVSSIVNPLRGFGSGGEEQAGNAPDSSSSARPSVNRPSAERSGVSSSSRPQENSPFPNPDIFTTMMQGISNELFQALQGQSNHSIADFLSQLGNEYVLQNGEGLFTDLFHVIAGHLTFADLMMIFFGNSQPIERLREPLQQFVGQSIMNGDSVTDDNISRAVERLIQDMQPDIVNVAGRRSTNNNIDYQATLTMFIRIHLQTAIRMLMNSTASSGFGRMFYEFCRNVIHEFIVLTRFCLAGGQADLEALLRERLQSISAEASPAMQNTMSHVAMQQLRLIVPSVTENDVQRFIVYQTADAEADATVELPSSNNSFESACDTAEEEAEDTDSEMTSATGEKDEQSSGNTDSQDARPSRIDPTLLSYLHPPSDSNGDSDIQIVYGSEDWHSAIPAEWIPVITRDIVRQRRQAPQPALSDAYLSGMPNKRRKIMNRERREEFGDVQSVVMPEMVKRAAEQAGAQPTTSHGEIVEDIAESSRLTSAFQQELNAAINQRLESDPDFVEEKYPNTTKFFRRQ